MSGICECQTWYQYLIESLPTIILVVLAGGGGTIIYKFKDRIVRVLNRLSGNIDRGYQIMDDQKKSPSV